MDVSRHSAIGKFRSRQRSASYERPMRQVSAFGQKRSSGKLGWIPASGLTTVIRGLRPERPPYSLTNAARLSAMSGIELPCQLIYDAVHSINKFSFCHVFGVM